MDAAIYLMAILGCGEADAPCHELRLAEARYESREACIAATEEEVVRHQDLDYPVIVAQCRATEQAPQVQRASEVRLPAPEANPHYPASPERD